MSAFLSDPIERRQRRHEEVLASDENVECLDPVDSMSDGGPGDGEGRALWLQPDVRVSLLAEGHEVAIVDPFALEELQGGHGLCADEDEVEAARCLVVVRGIGLGVVGRPKGGTASDQPVDVDVYE